MKSARRWENGTPERKIEAFIGAWGVKTGDIANVNELLDKASRVFEVENTGDAATVCEAIKALGPAGRKALASRNVIAVMGESSLVDGGRADRTRYTEDNFERMMAKSKPELIDGAPFECEGQLDIDPAQLLRKVVSAVISSGNAPILREFPEVLAFFGSRIPQRHEVEHLHNVDETMFEAAEKWPNRRRV